MRSVKRGCFHRSVLLTGTAAIAAIALATPGAALAQEKSFDLPAQAASTGIPAFAQQAGIQLLTSGDVVRGRQTNAVRGTYEVDAALRMLLAGTGLETSPDTSGTGIVIIRSPGAPGEPLAGGENGDADRAVQAGQRGLSEILVVGSRTQNVDVRRTEDDPQPYVVFDAEQIKNSNATSLDDFLRTRLPMNTQNVGTDQRDGNNLRSNNGGMINLRGLGTNQTLVLVDGRRMPGVSEFDIAQTNISGIPLSAIERIEVLPSTAGAIFGGSAVGGVVNIILKHNYSGVDVAADYGNTFDDVTGDLKLSVNGGFSFKPTGTRVSFSASRNRTANLSYTDRADLLMRSREFLLQNNPNGFTSPPLGTTPNIRSTTGAILTLKSTGQSLGSAFTHVPFGYAGPSSDNSAALVANAGRYNLEIPDQPNVLIRGLKSTAYGLNVRQPITDGIEMFLDMNWDRSPARYHSNFALSGTLQASDVRNPFNQNIRINYILPEYFTSQYNLVKNNRINGGAIIQLPHHWSMFLEHSRGKSHATNVSNSRPISNADRATAIAAGLRDPIANPPGPFTILTAPTSSFGPSSASIENSSLRASGPLFSLPGGPINLSTLVERRRDAADYLAQYSDGGGFSPPGYFVIAPQSQAILSGYLEARIPLFSTLNGRPLLRELELQTSIRHDRYKTVGVSNNIQPFGATVEETLEAARSVPRGTNRIHSTDYLVALRYKPIDDLTLRASYSTGFLPPSVTQITRDGFVIEARGTDPKRGGEALTGDESGNFTIHPGGNPNLQPEISRSFSLGAIMTPAFVPGLRISVDYTSISKSSEILRFSDQFIINNEDSFPGRVIRGPNLPGDPVGYAGPILEVDYSYFNAGKSRVKSIDYQVDYNLETVNAGDFHLYAVASQSLVLKRQLTPDLGYTNFRGFIDGPIKWRGNLGLDWRKGPMRLGWNMQYYSSYKGFFSTFTGTFPVNQGTEIVPAQSYHDLSASYAFAGPGVLTGLEIAGGIQNVFNTYPPVINASNGIYSTFGDPRLRRFTLSLRKHF